MTEYLALANLIFSVLLPVSQPAPLAPLSKETHGGAAYVCRDPSGKITRAELLDLWEPETLTFNRDVHGIEGIDESAAMRLQSAVNHAVGWSLAGDIYPDLMTRVQWFGGNMAYAKKPMPLTNDIYPDYKPEPGCQIEQVATYGFDAEYGRKLIRVSQEIYTDAHFGDLDRAALFMHEAIYEVARQKLHDTDSIRTRGIVSRMFSIQDDPDALSDRFYPLIQKQDGAQFVFQTKDTGTLRLRLKSLNHPVMVDVIESHPDSSGTWIQTPEPVIPLDPPDTGVPPAERALLEVPDGFQDFEATQTCLTFESWHGNDENVIVELYLGATRLWHEQVIRRDPSKAESRCYRFEMSAAHN